MSYDLVIKNGTVIDGSGAPGFRSDVGIRDGKIAGFGRIRQDGARTIDAEGLVVTPGFVDGHTHMDAQVSWDPLGTGSCWHGVTSVVMGNCGFTLAPCRPEDRDLLMHSLEAVEDISADVMKAGIDWTWTTYREYLDRLEALPKGINYGGYVGHSPLRRYVMGERANGPATPEDVELMRAELEDALRAGALGFSTSRSLAHLTPERTPVLSRLADWDEVRALVGLMGDLNAGVFEIARAMEWDELGDLAVETGVPITFGMLFRRAAPESGDRLLELIHRTNARGGRMFGQAHTKAVSTLWSFRTRLPYDRLPEWQAVRALPLAQQIDALRNAETRERLVASANNPPPPAGPRAGGEASIPRREGYASVRVLLDPVGPNPTVAALAEARNADPVEVIIDLAIEHGLDVFFQQELANDLPERQLETILDPQLVPTFSDSGAHVGQIVDCALQTHLLAYWVRKEGALTLEAAVRRITFDTASAWGLHDRGLLRVGLNADVVVFDPATVGPVMPAVANDLPAGGVRLVQKSQGFVSSIVNGVEILRDGDRPTGDLPGRVIRGPLARGAGVA